MGPKKQEIQMRIQRYLNRYNPDPLDFTVEGERMEADLAHFCVTSSDEVFEECIACLYDNDRYHRRIRFLGRRWKLLDWLLGPLEHRIYRTQFRQYDDTTEQYRKHFRSYLKREYYYTDKRGGRHAMPESNYNLTRLEALLPDVQYEKLMLLRHGPEYHPPSPWDSIEYEHPVDTGIVGALPPHIEKWMLTMLRGSTFSRNEVG